jgi:predicted enzyme related to lactoylglutathione lyase
MIPTLQAVTVCVSDLERSRQFYENVIGFEQDAYYEPTRWQSYLSEGRAYFCITEDRDFTRTETLDIINFDVDDLDALWAQVQGRCTIETPLATTPWGSRKFVIHDPDGYKLGFCQKRRSG